MQEGGSIWKSFTKFVNKAGKYIKKHKLVSKVGNAIAPVVSLAYPQAGKVIGVASQLAKQHGWGVRKVRGRSPRDITKAQSQCVARGLCYPLKSGGVSLQPARDNGHTTIRNITPAQVRALSRHLGRMRRDGSIGLAGGPSSGFYSGSGLDPIGGASYTHVVREIKKQPARVSVVHVAKKRPPRPPRPLPNPAPPGGFARIELAGKGLNPTGGSHRRSRRAAVRGRRAARGRGRGGGLQLVGQRSYR